MKSNTMKPAKFFLIIFAFALSQLLITPTAECQEEYVFERMWPVQQSQWFFSQPMDVTSDSHGNIYVVDSSNHRIKKFTSDGILITQWGKQGERNGEFNLPYQIALDQDENIYVTDHNNCRVQKFDQNGNFIMKFGDRSELKLPTGIAVDSAGNIYVGDTYNYSIKKYNSFGQLLTQWGNQGSAQGEFELQMWGGGQLDLNIDENDNIYVVDHGNHRVQIFSSSGAFISAYGQYGDAEGEFMEPIDIAFDDGGNIFVSQVGRIQKFDNNWGYTAIYAGLILIWAKYF